jgi:hypothetical protein
MSFISSATVLSVKLLNYFTISGQITSALLIKYSRINYPCVKVLELVTIKLDNLKPASTAESFGLLLLWDNSCFFLTDNFNSHSSLVVNTSLFVMCFIVTFNIMLFANGDRLSTNQTHYIVLNFRTGIFLFQFEFNCRNLVFSLTVDSSRLLRFDILGLIISIMIIITHPEFKTGT